MLLIIWTLEPNGGFVTALQTVARIVAVLTLAVGAAVVLGEAVPEEKHGVQEVPVLVAEEKPLYEIFEEKAWTDDGEGTTRRQIPGYVIIFDSTQIHVEYDYVSRLFNVYGTGLDKARGKTITMSHAEGVHKVDIWDRVLKGKNMSRFHHKIKGVEIIVLDTALNEQWKFEAKTHTDSLSSLSVVPAGH